MLTNTDVLAWTGIKNPNLDTLALVVSAVNFYVDGLPSIDRETDGTWAPTTKFAAVVLASRWLARKTSANGVSATTDGGAIYVTKYDSDIARALHIDGFQKPMVG